MQNAIAFNFINRNFTDKRRLFGSYILLFEKYVSVKFILNAKVKIIFDSKKNTRYDSNATRV